MFTGGSLIVGSAARTDLVCPDRTEELARAQYALAAPAGRPARRRRRSSRPTAPDRSVPHRPAPNAPPPSPRAGHQPAATGPDENAFVAQLLGSLGSYPPYFAPARRDQPPRPALLAGAPTLAPLSVDAVRPALGRRRGLIDARPLAASPRRTSPAQSRSRCARCLPVGWAGSPRPTGR